MEFICRQELIFHALQIVQRGASAKSTMPELESVKMEVKENTVTLKTNNLDLAVSYTMPVDIQSEGTVLVNVRLLTEIIRKLPQERIRIRKKKQLIEIMSEKSFFHIKEIHGDGFAEIPKFDVEFETTLHSNQLKTLIRNTVFSAGIDSPTTMLTGLLLDIQNDTATMVGIDSFRMAVRRITVEDKEQSHKVIIPAKSLAELAHILEKQNEKVRIQCGSRQVRFVFERFFFVSRLLEGDFVDYQGIIPKEMSTKFEIKKDWFEDAVERAMIVVTGEENKQPVNFRTDEDGLHIAIATNVGDVLDTIDLDVIGEHVDVSFNPRFFLDCLRVIEDKKVLFQCNTAVGPCLITPLEKNHYIYLIGAVRR